MKKLTLMPTLTNMTLAKQVLDAICDANGLTTALISNVRVNPNTSFTDYLGWVIFCINHPQMVNEELVLEDGKVFLPQRQNMYIGPVYLTDEHGKHYPFINLYENTIILNKELNAFQYFVFCKMAACWNCVVHYAGGVKDISTGCTNYMYVVYPKHLVNTNARPEILEYIKISEEIAASTPSTIFMRRQVHISKDLSAEEVEALNGWAAQFGAEFRKFERPYTVVPTYAIFYRKKGAVTMAEMPNMDLPALLKSVDYPRYSEAESPQHKWTAEEIVDFLLWRMEVKEKYKLLPPSVTFFMNLHMWADLVIQMYLLHVHKCILIHLPYVCRPDDDPDACCTMSLAEIVRANP